jgi:hypothetical protein
VCSENGLPLARTMNVEYDERAEIKQSETEPTRVHTYNIPPLPLYPPLPAPQLPIPQLPAPQMGNPGFFTPTTGNLPWASEALRNAALGQSAFRNTAPGSTEAGSAGAGNVGPGNATSGTSATRSTGARSKTSRSATSGGANSGSAASRSAAPMSNEALGSKFSNKCFLPPFDIPFLSFQLFCFTEIGKEIGKDDAKWKSFLRQKHPILVKLLSDISQSFTAPILPTLPLLPTSVPARVPPVSHTEPTYENWCLLHNFYEVPSNVQVPSSSAPTKTSTVTSAGTSRQQGYISLVILSYCTYLRKIANCPHFS